MEFNPLKKTRKKIWSVLFRGKAFSPKGFLIRALWIVIVFGILELAGLRGYTMILSGTSPTAEANDMGALAPGCLYIVIYGAFVVVAPILILAAGVFHLLLWDGIYGRKPGKKVTFQG